MTKSTITREQLLEIIETDHVQCGEASYLARMALAAMDSEPHTDDELSNLLWYSQEATCHSDQNYYCEFQRLATPGLIAGIIRELQERRKADSEPVAWTWHYREQWHVTNDERRAEFVAKDGDVAVLPLYRHAQPAKGLELAGWQFKSVNGDWLGLIDEHGKNQAVRDGYEVREVFAMADGVNDRDQVRREHAEWSQTTFGNVGPVGPLKHLSKEALEAAAEPGDLSEWADMQFLLWDAQRRAGITDEQITQAMIEKLAVNKQREWPEPKDGEPRLHIKAQPAPVVLDDVLDALQKVARIRLDLNDFDGDRRGIADCLCDVEEALIKVVNRRAAMLQEHQKSAGTEAICRSNENVQAVEVQSLTSINPAPDLVSLQKKAESIIGNYPGIPDGSGHCPCCGKKLRRACSVEGCGGKHVAHGLCQKHYDMKRWENPEQVERFREAGRRYLRKKKSTVATPQEPKP